MSVEVWDDKHLEFNKEWYQQGNGPLISPDERILSLAIVRYYRIKDKSKAKILDLGCGGGVNAFWLGKQGYSVTGIDFSLRGLQYAKALCDHMPNVKFQHVDLTKKLPFPNESFDFIYDMRALECLNSTEIAAIADEVKRLLIDGGVFMSITASPNRLPDLDVPGAPATRLTKEQLKKIYECPEFRLVIIRENMATDTIDRPVYDWYIRAEKGIKNGRV